MTKESRLSLLNAMIAFLALPLVCPAQYQNSATGQTYNNSYSAMLSVTNTMTQNFTTMQRQYLGSISSATSAYGTPSTNPQPALRRYPITATDFRGSAARDFPERLAAAMGGATPEQKDEIEKLCNSLLAEYEKTNRRNNLASAMAYSVRVSLEIERGTTQSPAEAANLIRAFNDTFAGAPAYRVMTAGDKQQLYESSILTGGMAAVLYLQGVRQNNPALQQQGRAIAHSFLQRWAPRM